MPEAVALFGAGILFGGERPLLLVLGFLRQGLELVLVFLLGLDDEAVAVPV